MVQIAHIIREGGGQLLAPNDLKSLVPPNLDHWHPPLRKLKHRVIYKEHKHHNWSTELTQFVYEIDESFQLSACRPS